MQTNKKKIFILLGVIAVIAIIIIVAVSQGKQTNQTANDVNNQAAQTQATNATATPATNEVAPSKSAVAMATVTPEIISTAVQIAPGASLITKDNKVITPEGTPVKLNVLPSSSEAPKESAPVSVSQIPSGSNTVKLSVSMAGFSPNTFTVKEGQLVNFALTSTDEFTHVWLSDDKALTGTILGVAGHETRIKSWNAPKKGTYTFRCDIPGHAARGEVGTMIVQ